MQITNCLAAAAAFGLANAASFQNASTASLYRIDHGSNVVLTVVQEDPADYGFPLLQNANTTELFPMPACRGHVIAEATIDQLQDYMSSGNLTSVELTSCYLQRLFQTREYIK